jgi:hypothetical protein
LYTNPVWKVPPALMDAASAAVIPGAKPTFSASNCGVIPGLPGESGDGPELVWPQTLGDPIENKEPSLFPKLASLICFADPKLRGEGNSTTTMANAWSRAKRRRCGMESGKPERNEETSPKKNVWGLGRKTRKPLSWCVRPPGAGQKYKSQETRKGNERWRRPWQNGLTCQSRIKCSACSRVAIRVFSGWVCGRVAAQGGWY